MQDYSIRETLFHKRIHFVFLNLVAGILLTIIFEVSFTNVFKNKQWMFLLFFMVYEGVLLTIAQAILKEKLLVTPIVIASEVIQFVTVMAAKTFQEFLIYYMIRLMV